MGNDALCVVVCVCACMWASPRALGPIINERAVVPCRCVACACVCYCIIIINTSYGGGAGGGRWSDGWGPSWGVRVVGGSTTIIISVLFYDLAHDLLDQSTRYRMELVDCMSVVVHTQTGASLGVFQMP